jgi:CBS domain-containing protein
MVARGPAGPMQWSADMSVASLGTFVTYNPIAVSAGTSLADAWQRMQEGGFHHLPVVDDQRRVVGILSEIDVAGAQGRASAPVETVMVRQVVTVDVESAPRPALEAILSNGFHSVPIVEQGRLVGMVTSTDYLREFSYGASPIFQDPLSWHMSPALAHIDIAASIHEAVDALSRNRCRLAAVVDGGRAVGALSQRDCRRAQLRTSGGPQAQQVGDLLPKSHVVFTPELTLGLAAGRLLEHGLRAVVVADRLGRVAGILSEDDILAALLEHVS